MPQPVFAYAIPELAPPKSLEGSVAIIIDLLRASTTIATALDHGASEVIPVSSPEAAVALKKPGDLLGGERGGVLIPGFDLANSPREYARERVEGKRIVFTTTNGTRALHIAHAAGAKAIVVGALINLSAVASHTLRLDLPIHLICAGTNGQISMEDCLAAGAFIERLTDSIAPGHCVLGGDDQALLMLKLWRAESANPGQLIDAISSSKGGRGLTRLGLESDIAGCCRIDTSSIVPVFDPLNRSLKPAT